MFTKEFEKIAISPKAKKVVGLFSNTILPVTLAGTIAGKIGHKLGKDKGRKEGFETGYNYKEDSFKRAENAANEGVKY